MVQAMRPEDCPDVEASMMGTSPAIAAQLRRDYHFARQQPINARNVERPANEITAGLVEARRNVTRTTSRDMGLEYMRHHKTSSVAFIWAFKGIPVRNVRFVKRAPVASVALVTFRDCPNHAREFWGDQVGFLKPAQAHGFRLLGTKWENGRPKNSEDW